MMDLSDLVMAQQALLSAELDLEQNYIAYIAGLAKLQVLTGGAFNPAPYLAASLDTGVVQRQSTSPVTRNQPSRPATTPSLIVGITYC